MARSEPTRYSGVNFQIGILNSNGHIAQADVQTQTQTQATIDVVERSQPTVRIVPLSLGVPV